MVTLIRSFTSQFVGSWMSVDRYEFNWTDKRLKNIKDSGQQSVIYYSNAFGLEHDPKYRELRFMFRFEVSYKRGHGKFFSVCLKHSGNDGWPEDIIIKLSILNEAKNKSLNIGTSWRGVYKNDMVVGDEKLIPLSQVAKEWFQTDGSLHVRCILSAKVNRELDTGGFFDNSAAILKGGLANDLNLISTDGNSMAVSRFPLMAQSDVLRKKLTTASRGRISFETNMDYATLQMIVSFCYTSKVDLKDIEFAAKVYHAATEYKMNALIKLCCQFSKDIASVVTTGKRALANTSPFKDLKQLTTPTKRTKTSEEIEAGSPRTPLPIRSESSFSQDYISTTPNGTTSSSKKRVSLDMSDI